MGLGGDYADGGTARGCHAVKRLIVMAALLLLLLLTLMMVKKMMLMPVILYIFVSFWTRVLWCQHIPLCR